MKPYEFTKVELPLRADESLYHIPMQKYSVNKKGEIILKFNEAWPNTPETLVLHLTGKVLRLQPLAAFTTITPEDCQGWVSHCNIYGI